MVSPRENSLANTVAFAVRGADGMALLAGLDLEGICASSGSACSAGSLEPSHVLAALGRRDAAGSLIRFSLGPGFNPGRSGFCPFRFAGSHSARAPCPAAARFFLSARLEPF